MLLIYVRTYQEYGLKHTLFGGSGTSKPFTPKSMGLGIHSLRVSGTCNAD